MQIGDTEWKIHQEQLEKDRLRQDYKAKMILSENTYKNQLVRSLQNTYLLNEKLFFHPKKCQNVVCEICSLDPGKIIELLAVT